MTAAGSLGAIVELLDVAGIPHMLAGSFASSIHGQARTTADIDVVIEATLESLQRFLGGIDHRRFYVDESDATRAVEKGDLFNVIDTETGWKIDLVVRKERPFSVNEFRRRLPMTVLGVDVHVATAEDTVLAKLEWSGRGGSERQVRDVIDILRTQGRSLDDRYLDRWAAELNLGAELASVRQAAGHDGSTVP